MLSPEQKRREKFERELKNFEKRCQMQDMMEEEMRKKMMERRDPMEMEFLRYEKNDKHREKDD